MNWWFLAFVATVWVCWGAYGVQVHSAIVAFGKSGIRSMVALSAAYGVVALLGGLSAVATGGHQSPYSIAAVPILVFLALAIGLGITIMLVKRITMTPVKKARRGIGVMLSAVQGGGQ